MPEILHARHPQAGVHNLVAGLRSYRRWKGSPKRHLTRCGQLVAQRSIAWQGSDGWVTCAACRQAGGQGV